MLVRKKILWCAVSWILAIQLSTLPILGSFEEYDMLISGDEASDDWDDWEAADDLEESIWEDDTKELDLLDDGFIKEYSDEDLTITEGAELFEVLDEAVLPFVVYLPDGTLCDVLRYVNSSDYSDGVFKVIVPEPTQDLCFEWLPCRSDVAEQTYSPVFFRSDTERILDQDKICEAVGNMTVLSLDTFCIIGEELEESLIQYQLDSSKKYAKIRVGDSGESEECQPDLLILIEQENEDVLSASVEQSVSEETEEIDDGFFGSEAEVLDATSNTARSFEEQYQKTGAYLARIATSNAPLVGSIGGEWEILGLVRSEQQVPSFVYQKYLDNLEATLQQTNGILHDKKYTEYSRVVLALTCLGENVTDFRGYDVLTPLADFDKVVWQGINGACWGLIALDSHQYVIPEISIDAVQTTREGLIEHLLAAELKSGGWTLSGSVADVDITAMVLQSLAPYRSSNARVAEAIERGIKKLSSMQSKEGEFGTQNGTKFSYTAESCAQVVVALTALGIDPTTDSRFIKNGNSALDGLLHFGLGEGFAHLRNDSLNPLATEQGYYALAAYDRFVNHKTSLYDMTDIECPLPIVTPSPTPDPAKPTPKPTVKPTPKPTVKPTQAPRPTTIPPIGPTTTPSSSDDTESTDRVASGSTKSVSLSAGEGSSSSGTGKTNKQKSTGSKTSDGKDTKKSSEEKALENDKKTKEDQKKTSETQKKKESGSGKNDVFEKYTSIVKTLVDMAEQERTENHRDEVSGIHILENQEEKLPWYIQLRITAELPDEAELQQIQGLLGNDYRLFQAWDIELYDMIHKVSWEPKDIIRINFPMIDLGEYDHVVVIHWKSDGKIEFLDANVGKDVIRVDSVSFSRYAIAGIKGDLQSLLEPKSEKTDLKIWLICGGSAVVLLVFMLIVRLLMKEK